MDDYVFMDDYMYEDYGWTDVRADIIENYDYRVQSEGD